MIVFGGRKPKRFIEEGSWGMIEKKQTDPPGSPKINKAKKIKLLGLIIILGMLWSIWSWVPVTERFTVKLSDGGNQKLRIALITDLHSCSYGKEQKNLISRIDREEPDIILLGGDFLDDRLKDDNAMTLAKELVEKYPCYYVTGNHEYWSGRVEEMKDGLRQLGVTVLEGECSEFTHDGATYDICGVDDPTGMTDLAWKAQLERAYSRTSEQHVKLLLTHRPERVSDYENYDFDLILAGHAHAGQFRVPFLNRGVFAPNQGFWAEYVNGSYELSGGQIMIVSRGLARESTPLPRFFNHPELVIVDLLH